ncbi:MAG TPA: sodium/solute symporter [Thermoguttaceae bacterium]|nr:sodium/solute symporter [Thermoguttaceae bacterium]
MLGFYPLFAAAEGIVGQTESAMSWFDWLVVALYLCGVVGIGLWAGLRRKSTEGSSYFLAEKSLTWPVIGLALFSTNISTTHLVGLAQAGYKDGLAYGNFEWMAAFTLICLSLFFAPFYLRSKVTTLPDFLEKRYCRPCRDWLAAISILSAIFIHLGFTLFTGVVVLEGFVLNNLVAHPEHYRLLTLCIVGGIAGLYTIIGGLKAVVLTESFDTIVLLIGAICITLIGYNAVGGWDGLQASVDELAVQASQPATTAAGTLQPEDIPKNVEKHLTLLRGHGDPSDLPWYAVLLGYPVIGIWYWCSDQTIVQRVLGAKDENHARVGPLFTGFIKILPVFLFVLPGVICLALIHQGKLPTLPMMSDNTTPNTEATLARLIQGLLPTGLKGLMAAALLAALTGAVSGALNSIATLFSYDLLKRWRPQTSDRALILTGRIVTFCALVAAIAWSPYLEHLGGIFKGINTMISFIAPPITALFLWGVFWRKATGRAALTTAWFGTLLGIACFVLSFCGKLDEWTLFFGFRVPFLLPGVYLFVVCSISLALCSYSRRLTIQLSAIGTFLGAIAAIALAGGALTMLASDNPTDPKLLWPTWLPWILVPAFLYCVSSPLLLLVTLLTPEQPISPEQDSLVWKSILEPLRGQAWRGIGNFRVLTVVLAVTMVVLYWVFS